jgi:hypothetical protein
MAAVVGKARRRSSRTIARNATDRSTFSPTCGAADRSLALAAQAGIRSEATILDPGIGRQDLAPERRAARPDLRTTGSDPGRRLAQSLSAAHRDGIATLIGTVALI